MSKLWKNVDCNSYQELMECFLIRRPTPQSQTLPNFLGSQPKNNTGMLHYKTREKNISTQYSTGHSFNSFYEKYYLNVFKSETFSANFKV